MENSLVFALRRWILRKQNPRAISDRPYGYFFDIRKPPEPFGSGGIFVGFKCQNVGQAAVQKFT